MNQTTQTAQTIESAQTDRSALAAEISKTVRAQKEFFQSGLSFDPACRKNILRLLKDEILLREKDIEQALYADLGKSADEAYLSEIGLVLAAIDYQIRHLRRFAWPQIHLTPIHQMPALYETIRIPYGTVLVMAPWNYPFYLAMVPLVEAIAAGNTVVLKTGHAAKATSQVMKELLQAVFESEYVAVYTGGRDEISALLEQPFDSIFFTGGKSLGTIVMTAAAKQLIPVTLELGGKSPAVVDESANLAMAAKRIVFGKLLNAGQTCVAPDYVCVHASVYEPFLAALKHEFARQCSNPEQIGKIISRAHYDRLIGLAAAEPILYGGRASENTLQIEPTIVGPVGWEDPVMADEIFGPILPVLVFDDFKALMDEIRERPTPLAFYLFTRKSVRKSAMKYIQPFGGGCINDTIIQLASDTVPFGGMGKSGMGQYHGRWGFETFTHIKTVVTKPDQAIFDLPFRYTTRKPWMAALIRKLLR